VLKNAANPTKIFCFLKLLFSYDKVSRMITGGNSFHEGATLVIPRYRVALLLTPMAFLLSGCFIPLAVSIASYGFSGITYASNGKSLTDMVISQAVHEDCASFRVFEVEWPCRDFTPEQQREAVIQEWRMAERVKARTAQYARYPALYQEPPIELTDKPIPHSVIAQADAAKATAEQVIMLAELKKNGGKTLAAAEPAAAGDDSDGGAADAQAAEQGAQPSEQYAAADATADLSGGMRPDGKATGAMPIQLAALPSHSAVAAAPSLSVAVDTRSAVPAVQAVTAGRPATAQLAVAARPFATVPAPSATQMLATSLSFDGQSADGLSELPTTFVPPLGQLTTPRKKPLVTAKAPASGSAYLVLATYESRAGAEQAMTSLASVALPFVISRADNQTQYRLVSGPYAESQMPLARKRLAAAGFRDTRPIEACHRASETDCVALDSRQLAHLAVGQ
jgi:hypothetical protein